MAGASVRAGPVAEDVTTILPRARARARREWNFSEIRNAPLVSVSQEIVDAVCVVVCAV